MITIRRLAGVLLSAIVSLAACPRALADTAAAPASEPRKLQAIFLDVDGKVRWRADGNAEWRDAKVNDLVDPGAEIRTGLRSRAALRVGRNATLLVDAGTAFQIPQLEQEGETLRTLASVKTGRVDFKVDKVGYSNDFRVATPQTTLSVRGTGFGVNTGPLHGAEIVGARTNMINAIELKYVASNLKFFMSGGASSSSGNPDPVKSAWMSTLGPPQVAGTIADKSQLEQAAAQGQAGNAPTNSQQFQQINAAESQDLPRTDPSALAGLLTLQEGELRGLKVVTNGIVDDVGVPPRSGSARQSIEDAHDAAVLRQTKIAATLAARTSLGSDANALSAIEAQSNANREEMLTLRSAMDAAIDADDDQLVASKLDRMGQIDDQWQGQLKSQAQALVVSLAGLQQSLEDAAAAAQSADGQFNAILPVATQKLSVVAATAQSLAGFRSAIEGYQRAVTAAFQSGDVGADSMNQLRRSVAILQEASQRIGTALAALQSATERLADAQNIVTQGQALSLAITALLEGRDISAVIPTIQGTINDNIEAIESARFSAFFAAAAAGASAIEERGDLALADGNDASGQIQDIESLRSAAEQDVNDVVALANAMDQFWNIPAGGGGISTKARMEALLSQSDADRVSMSTMLGQLNDLIGQQDQTGATTKLGQMQTLDGQWQNADTGFLAEANGINDDMQGRLAAILAAQGRVTSFESSFEGLMSAAEQKRDSSVAAAARATQLLDRLQAYKTQYEALVAANRGGAAGATQVANAAALIGGSLAAYQAGIDASEDAAAAAATARTNGQRVLNAAASNALARQAALQLATDLATASQGLRDAIDANAALIHQDLLTGEQNYNAAFGGQGGGGGGGG